MKQKIEIEVDVPEGLELTGGYKECGCTALEGKIQSITVRCDVRRVKRYRPPVLPADWGKECEGLDCDGEWVTRKLLGYSKDDTEDGDNWILGTGIGQYEGFFSDCRIEVTE